MYENTNTAAPHVSRKRQNVSVIKVKQRAEYAKRYRKRTTQNDKKKTKDEGNEVRKKKRWAAEVNRTAAEAI